MLEECDHHDKGRPLVGAGVFPLVYQKSVTRYRTVQTGLRADVSNRYSCVQSALGGAVVAYLTLYDSLREWHASA